MCRVVSLAVRKGFASTFYLSLSDDRGDTFARVNPQSIPFRTTLGTYQIHFRPNPFHSVIGAKVYNLVSSFVAFVTNFIAFDTSFV